MCTEMWRSGVTLYKCWLTLCFGNIYICIVLVTCYYLVLLPLDLLEDLLEYLTTRVPELYLVLVIVTWLNDGASDKDNRVVLNITSCVVAWSFFTLLS